MKIQRYRIFGLLLLFCLSGANPPHARTLYYGGLSGWGGAPGEGLRETRGWRGYRALTLAPPGRDSGAAGDADDMDILLLSDPEGILNPAGYYRIEGSYEISSSFPARGETAIRPLEGGIQLLPSEGAMWSPGSEWGDFTLDFRLRPSGLADGDLFLSWEGRDAGGRGQSVTARVENRRLIWEFHHFFQRGPDRGLNLRLVGPALIPGEWRHHRIRFTLDASDSGRSGASPGLLEYLVDGVPADMVHASPDGREGGEIFTPRVGVFSDRPLRLAPSFSGYLDEFRLTAAAVHSAEDASVSGRGRTELIDSGYPGSTLQGIRARYETPGASRVRFFARSFNTLPSIVRFNPGDSSWMMLSMDEEPEDPSGSGRWYRSARKVPIEGRYFMVGYVLEPDPGADAAPVLSALELEYSPRLPPRSPRGFMEEPGADGRTGVSWSADSESGAAGWWVSWGLRPGNYIPAGPEDVFHGTAWVPRDADGRARQGFTWPREMNRVIYVSIRAAWGEGGPDGAAPPGPADYQALSSPSREISIVP